MPDLVRCLADARGQDEVRNRFEAATMTNLTTDTIQFTVYPDDQELQAPGPETAL